MKRSGVSKWLLFVLLSIWSGKAGADPVDWPTLGFSQIVPNAFPAVTVIAHAGDGSQRIFIAQQSGRIWIIQSNSVLSQPFLDINDRIVSGGEQGLLGMAFPRGFATNSHFYVDYTRKSDGATVIARFSLTGDPNVADANSEEIIKIIAQPYANHNGGQLAFGPDGYLYIGMGDGGGADDPQNNGQNKNALLGKILRIDVESGALPYSVPTNNPYVGNPSYAPEIWAYGLRNPWRFSFDRLTGDLYIADVGQNSYEEINFQPAGSAGGQNYGWRIMEGPVNHIVPAGFTNFSALTLPIAWYGHQLGVSVSGGYVSRGLNEPRMEGVYFYGDFGSGRIWGLSRDGTNWQNVVLLAPGAAGVPFYSISTFGEDEQGNLLLADYGAGRIVRVTDTHEVWTPSFSPTNGTAFSNTVTVSCLTTGAVIHVTVNGADPTEADPIVASGGTIQISTGVTNKARAFRQDLAPSGIARAIFTNRVATPVFSPPPGAVTNGTRVTISTITPGAAIYYTTNNTTPTTNSVLYSTPILINGTILLRAIGVKSGYSNSAFTSVSYSLIKAAVPVFEPSQGPLTNGALITIASATPNAVIYYTTNGSAATTTSAVYSTPLVYTSPMTLNAISHRSDLGPSDQQSVFYGLLDVESYVVTTFAGSPTAGFSNSIAPLATFSGPTSVAFDSAGNMYVTDRENSVIRKISTSGEVTTFAGTGTAGAVDGDLATAQLNRPVGIFIDRNDVAYVADGCYLVRKISDNNVTTLTAALIGCDMGQLELNSVGNLYVGSFGTLKTISTNGAILGSVGPGGCCGGGWGYLVGVGIDPLDNVYVVSWNYVYKIESGNSATVYAGAQDPAYSDGPRLLARFYFPLDLAVDSATNLIVTDTTRVRKIRPDGWVSTIAGTGISGYRNGRGSEAQFDIPWGLCADTNGNVYVADSNNNCIRKISPDTARIGVADDWQRAHFGFVGIDPTADADHDGQSNYSEFWSGTDPLDVNSVLAIDRTSIVSEGQIRIRWQTVAGKSYLIQYSSDLSTWATLGGPIVGDGSVASVVDSSATLKAGQRFYRIVLNDF